MIRPAAVSRWTLMTVLAVLLGLAAASVALAATAGTTRMSVNTAGLEQDGVSQYASISDDGLIVAFASDAPDLVAGVGDGTPQVYVRDRSAGTTALVSMSSLGFVGDGASPFAPSVSANGRYVTFESDATNLIHGDTNDVTDVFVHDLVTRETERVSVGLSGEQLPGGGQSPSISGDGRFVAFTVPGETDDSADVYVWDRDTRNATLVSAAPSGDPASGWSGTPSISDDGRFVAFYSDAPNLTAAADTNGAGDIFRRDLVDEVTVRVSVGASGAQANGESAFPSVSADGSRVAFASDATNLVANDTNTTVDVFVRDLAAGTTTRVSVTASGAQADGTSLPPSIPADGLHAPVACYPTTLLPGATNGMPDVFVRDVATAVTRRVSVKSSGAQVDFGGDAPSISATGCVVAFDSEAPDLVAGDTNEWRDVFVNDTTPPAATVTTTLKAKASTSRTTRGKYVTISSTLTGGVPALSRVRYQVRLPGKSAYTTISSTRPTSASGVSSVRYKVLKKGTYYFKARFLGIPGFAPSTSNVVKVVVR